MQTIKTAVVVVLLLGVLYGVYTVLNTPEHELTELQWPMASTAQPPVIDMTGAEPGSSAASGLDSTYGSFSPAELQSPPTESQSLVPPDTFAHMPPQAEAFGSRQAGFDLDPEAPLPAEEQPASPASVYGPSLSESAPPSTYSPADYGSGSSYSGADTAEPEPNAPSRYAPVPSDAPPITDSPPAQASDLVSLPTDPNQYPEAPATQDNAPNASSSGGSGSRTPQATVGVRAFQNAKRSAAAQIEQGNFREALFTLSIFYNSPDLTADEQQTLLDFLDPLAGKVIYSKEHLVTGPHKVGREENLYQVAEKHRVPWQLLANINGIADPRVLVPGTLLKVVPGPFRADVDITRGELTVFANRLYAGRFPISIGQDPGPIPGTYAVRDKQHERTYYAASGRSFAPNDPNNPFGSVWIDLGNEMAIHGSPANGSGGSQGLGCIGLSPRDANDVYGILSAGSQVTIR